MNIDQRVLEMSGIMSSLNFTGVKILGDSPSPPPDLVGFGVEIGVEYNPFLHCM